MNNNRVAWTRDFDWEVISYIQQYKPRREDGLVDSPTRQLEFIHKGPQVAKIYKRKCDTSHISKWCAVLCKTLLLSKKVGFKVAYQMYWMEIMDGRLGHKP